MFNNNKQKMCFHVWEQYHQVEGMIAKYPPEKKSNMGGTSVEH